MSFFLLVRYDDRLELLSSQLFDSRQDALAHLSQLTTEVGFEAWDAEVLVADADMAAPVLVVRPSATAAQSEPDAETDERVLDAFVSEADEPTDTESETSGSVDAGEPEPLAPVEDAWAEIALDSADAEEADLKTALSRTADTMEAQGVPVIVSVEHEGEVASLGEALAELEPESDDDAAEPMSQRLDEDSDSVELSVRTPTPPAIAWPWGTGSAETEAGDQPQETVSQSDAPADVPESIVEAPIELTSAAIEPVAVSASEPSDNQRSTEPESDFILDLEPDGTAAQPPGYSTPSDSHEEMSGMTCEDCVYVSTCPNRDERDPSSCGSFQWK